MRPGGAAHARAAVVDGVIGRAAQVEAPLRLLHGERIALLVQAVRRHRNRRGAPLRCHALKLEAVMIERRQDRIAAAGHAAERRAFDDLGHMLGGADGEAGHGRQRSEDRGIAGTPGDDHVDAGGERPLERAHAHLADDVLGRIHFRLVEHWHVVDRNNAVLAQRGLERTLRDVGV